MPGPVDETHVLASACVSGRDASVPRRSSGTAAITTRATTRAPRRPTRRKTAPRERRYRLEVVEPEPARDDPRVAHDVAGRILLVTIDETSALEASLDGDLTVAQRTLDETTLAENGLAVHREHGRSLPQRRTGPKCRMAATRSVERPCWPLSHADTVSTWPYWRKCDRTPSSLQRTGWSSAWRSRTG